MEYSYSFEGNIPYSMFNTTTSNVLNFIEEKREVEEWAKDPNAY